MKKYSQFKRIDGVISSNISIAFASLLQEMFSMKQIKIPIIKHPKQIKENSQNFIFHVLKS